MKFLVISASLLCILLIQISNGSSNQDSDAIGISTRAIPVRGLMNCSNPGDIYPLINGCNGWYMCGRDRLAYPSTCGRTRCYNNRDGRCTLVRNSETDINQWFECNDIKVRKFVAWKQDPNVFGLCTYPGLVTSMDRCPDNKAFDESLQDCIE